MGDLFGNWVVEPQKAKRVKYPTHFPPVHPISSQRDVRNPSPQLHNHRIRQEG